jgi:hypothetical protein
LPGLPPPRNRFVAVLAIGAIVLLAVGGAVGYFIGSSAVGHATLRVNVENRLATTQTVQVSVNTRLMGSLSIPAGQTMSLDIPVAYGTANGAIFDIEATTTTGGRDSSSVFVNTSGIFVVNLRIS